MSRLNDGQRSRIRNSKIGFIFQSYNLIPELNVFDNVDVPLRYRGFGSSKRREMIQGALDTVGLGGRTKHYPSQLSGGQQQRVAIARALVNDPELIMADEATGNLDSQTAVEILDLFDELSREGKTIVFVTHEAHVAARASHVLRMKDGQVEEMGPRVPEPAP